MEGMLKRGRRLNGYMLNGYVKGPARIEVGPFA